MGVPAWVYLYHMGIDARGGWKKIIDSTLELWLWAGVSLLLLVGIELKHTAREVCVFNHRTLSSGPKLVFIDIYFATQILFSI